MKFCEQGDCEYDDRGGMCCKCCDLKDECEYACWRCDDDDEDLWNMDDYVSLVIPDDKFSFALKK